MLLKRQLQSSSVRAHAKPENGALISGGTGPQARVHSGERNSFKIAARDNRQGGSGGDNNHSLLWNAQAVLDVALEDDGHVRATVNFCGIIHEGGSSIH